MEVEAKLKNGFATKERWEDIKHAVLSKLKLLLVACIPHKSKKYQVILDLYFWLRVGDTPYKSVNDNTTNQAPPESMTQLGSSLNRFVLINITTPQQIKSMYVRKARYLI